jgi:sorbitol-specific phosphotransferase system component IIBC
MGSNAVLKNMAVDGAIGTAVGTGLGALAEFALVAANVSLFVASPLLAPLVLLGWGASLGATVGAMVGAGKKDGPLSALVTDAIASGQVVLVAQTLSEAETATAQDVIRAAVGAVQDVSSV